MMGTLRAVEHNQFPTAAVIDTQSVKTTENGGPVKQDADKKSKESKHCLVVNFEGVKIAVAVHEASTQDRDGAPAVILGLPEKAPHFTNL